MTATAIAGTTTTKTRLKKGIIDTTSAVTSDNENNNNNNNGREQFQQPHKNFPQVGVEPSSILQKLQRRKRDVFLVVRLCLAN
jgi:hypothetical protein